MEQKEKILTEIFYLFFILFFISLLFAITNGVLSSFNIFIIKFFRFKGINYLIMVFYAIFF